MKMKLSKKSVKGKRKISDLILKNRTVYIYSADAQTRCAFMRDAEAEGFMFGDGVLPTERRADDIMAVGGDKTICYLGFVGRIAFRNADKVHGKKLIRVDYKKYSSGERKYIIKKSLLNSIRQQR